MSVTPILVILSRNPGKRAELAREFESLRADYTDLEIETYDMALMPRFDKKVHTVVLDLEEWVPSDEMVLSDLRNGGYRGPVVVLSKRIDEASSQSYSSDNIVFFDRSRGMNDLLGIMKRVMLGSMVAARRFPRHATDETAEIQIENQGIKFNCKVRNLSKGGALLEADRALAIRVGTQLKVKFHLKAMSRVYSVNARVAWINHLIFGIEFFSGD